MKAIFICLALLAPFIGYAKYDLSICAIFQDEAPYLKEWIEYHRLVGVKHFYMYNNDSHDDWINILTPYIDEGIVDVFYWPEKYADPFLGYKCPATAYQDCIDRFRNHTKWFAFIDVSDFIVPLEHKKITSELKHIDYGIRLNVKNFGTSYIPKIKGLMIENLTWRASMNNAMNTDFKSLIRSEILLRCDGPREFVMWKPYQDKTKRLVIHKYFTRDEDYFYNVKIPFYEDLGISGKVLMEKADQMNDEQDFEMLRFTDELKVRVYQ